MRFLCISDIHGHRAALQSVLEDAADRAFDQLVVAGDLLFPGPDPLGTWHLLLEHHALCVQGLSDRALATLHPDTLHALTEVEKHRLARMKEVYTSVGELIVKHLGRLPETARLPLESGQEMVVVHGAPADPTESMSADMTDEELNALLGDDPADLVICGGSHVPFDRQIGDTRIVNVGSVGESPSGTHADATLIATSPFGFSVHQFQVALSP